jgi:alpha-L-rhamnosidase
LRRFQNEDGLLENLNGKLFVEWSDANKYREGVNYPTNMLYAAMLASAGRLYREKSWEQTAKMLQAKIRHQSFDGNFFVDNALRQNGKLETTRNRTEICQYYAFYFGTVTTESHAELWRILRQEFGPQRGLSHVYPEISPANALNGNVLRLELLSRSGCAAQLLRESKDYLLYMAESTGTLWEHMSPRASLDHAFNSHIVNVLYRDALGIYSVDTIAKQIELRFSETSLDWCDGSVPTPEGEIMLNWVRVGRSIQYRCNVPTGYSVRAIAMNGLAIREV